MLAPLVAVLVLADRNLTIDGAGEGFSLGPSNELFSARNRQPGIRLTGIRSAPYSIRTPLAKALSAGANYRFGGAAA
jgi:hypothetical protein